MKKKLTAALCLAVLLAGCAGGSGSSQVYGQISGGVESSHIRYGH